MKTLKKSIRVSQPPALYFKIKMYMIYWEINIVKNVLSGNVDLDQIMVTMFGIGEEMVEFKRDQVKVFLVYVI